jgi:hypothetical protein
MEADLFAPEFQDADLLQVKPEPKPPKAAMKAKRKLSVLTKAKRAKKSS